MEAEVGAAAARRSAVVALYAIVIERVSCSLLVVAVVEMMLHPIANTIYELPMGSDEIVDWHVIDPIFCWVESILLVMHKQHLVHLVGEL